MTAEAQGALLDNIARGRCHLFALCGHGGVRMVRATYLVNALSLAVALRFGPTRPVTLDVPSCAVH